MLIFKRERSNKKRKLKLKINIIKTTNNHKIVAKLNKQIQHIHQ